jgi:hypothetical protein
MENLDSAYAAATSQGLAAAFEKKSQSLNRSISLWVVGLAIALGVSAYAGSLRINAILQAIGSGEAGSEALGLHFLLALISVGPAIWFAWLATKQIGQRFRLAEDYGFKAAVARAYEGFRRETVKFGDDLAAQLLQSALTRIDEQPLRFVEPPIHGSPMHELLGSGSVQEALRTVPNFVEQVKNAASAAVSRQRGAATATRPAAGSREVD